MIAAAIAQIFNPIAEFVIPLGIPDNEAKAEKQTHPLTVEIKINKCEIYKYSKSGKYSKLSRLFYAFYSLIHSYLFLRLNNFLLHLYFSV